MSKEPEIAATQYGDIKGTIALDGFMSGFLLELGRMAKIDPGYFVVGLRYYAEHLTRGDNPGSITLLAVDASVGKDGNSVSSYAKTHESIPVKEFRIEVPIGTVLDQIKRCSILISDKLIEGRDMIVG